MTILSPIEYSGNRCQRIEDIVDVWKNSNKNFDCFYDLFAGSGTFILNLIEANIANKYVINDAYGGFAIFWNAIKEQPKKVIEHYNKLLDFYLKQHDNTNKITFYNSLQKKFNQIFLNPESDIDQAKQAARFAFILNHALHNEAKFYESSQNTVNTQCLQCKLNDSQDGKLPIDEVFTERVMAVYNLFKSKSVQFTARDFYLFLNDITSKDALILDPPYPNCEDSSENPTDYLYFRTDTKIDLQNKLEVFYSGCINKSANIMLFYEVVGLGNSYQINLDKAARFIHSSIHQPYGAYCEYLYASPSLWNSLENSTSTIKVTEQLEIEINQVLKNLEYDIFKKVILIEKLVKENIEKGVKKCLKIK